MAICALCQQPHPLRESHVLPRFAQRRLKALAKAGGGRVLSHVSGRERVVQNFCFEPLLCAACEQRLSRWEKVGAELLRRKEFDPPGLVAGKAVTLRNLRYPELKLFLLSLLWRMGVSNLPDFALVELGPHEPVMREMLLAGEPGPTEQYGCSLQVLTDRTGRIPLTRGADVHRVDARSRLYRLILDGFLFIWEIGNSGPEDRANGIEWLLRDGGTWEVLFQDRRQVPFLHAALRPLMQRAREKA